MRGLPTAARIYAGAVITLAAVLLTHGALATLDLGCLIALTILFLITESAPAKLSLKPASVSMAYTAALAAVVLLGPAGAALLGATAVAVGRRGVAPIKRLFNGAQYVIAGYTAGVVFQALGGHPYRANANHWATHVIGPFTAALGTFVAVNLSLMGGILLISRQATWRELVAEGRDLVAGCLAFGMIGLLIAGIWPPLGALSPVLVLTPLFIARWAFQQTCNQQKAHAATIAALCQAVETKDYYTRGHSERVSRGSVMIAREIGMRAERVGAIRYAGMLHDVGKLGVPTKVLQKDGGLTEEEFAAIQLHPMRGLEIVRDIGFLDEALNGIMHHHERMDGTGYPMGLAGEEIPEFARVIAVADAFDSMTSTRSYRAARPMHVAVEELQRCAGTHFDPAIVDAFVAALERDGWKLADPIVVPDGDDVETTRHDHDDPSTPIRVTGDAT